jgi:hypothetical protein
MKTLVTLTMFAALLVGVADVPSRAADVTEVELMQAAIELGRQYDANYADKNPMEWQRSMLRMACSYHRLARLYVAGKLSEPIMSSALPRAHEAT